MYYFGIDSNGNIKQGTYDPLYTTPPNWPDLRVVQGNEQVWNNQTGYVYVNGQFVLK